MLEALAQPELAAEITLQPVRRYGVDAAVVFCDIVVPVRAVGFGVEIQKGVGPVVERPFRSESDLERLRPLEPETDVPYVLETVRLLAPRAAGGGATHRVRRRAVHRRQLPDRGRPVQELRQGQGPHARRAGPLGTTGRAPGRPGRRLPAGPGRGRRAGAAALRQLGRLPVAVRIRAVRAPRDPPPHRRPRRPRRADHPLRGRHRRTALPHGDGQARGHGHRLARAPRRGARQRLGPDLALQGNLDPAVCLAPWEVVEAETRDVLARAGTAPGHVFNLGHGVLPETDPGILTAVVDLVHAEGRAGVDR